MVKRIGIIGRTNSVMHGIIEGIHAFNAGRYAWSLRPLPIEAVETGVLHAWRPAAIISRFGYLGNLDLLKGLHDLPAVQIGRPMGEMPRIDIDYEAVASEAVGHFLERGYRLLAFFGPTSAYATKQLRDAFVHRCRAEGIEPFISPEVRRWPRTWQGLDNLNFRWINRLPKPVGIFCQDDLRASQISNACLSHAVSIPDQVAVLGLENEVTQCLLHHPAISSIMLPLRRMGMEVGRLLQTQFTGAKPDSDTPAFKPLGVECRGSTARRLCEDSLVTHALGLIEAHAHQGMDVEGLLDRLTVSRRTLETRFIQALGKTPHAEIIQKRVEAARRLLKTADHSVEQIARQSGFPSASTFCVQFKRRTGMTPTQARRHDRELS